MNDIRSGSRSGKAPSRRIPLAPMTRAVRSALAASAFALALGAGGNAFAAGCKAPVEQAMACQPSGLDLAPVVDLTVVHDAGAPLSVGVAAAAIEVVDDGDVVIDNADPITGLDVNYGVAAISGYSSEGNVDITNQAGADLYAGSVFGSAIGIYAQAPLGNATVDNAADITAMSYAGIADGIFASGADVDVTNSGTIETSGYAWSAGIEAQGADSVQVSNSGDITAIAGDFYQGYVYSYNYGVGGVFASSQGGQATGIYATAGEAGASVGNSGDIEVQGAYVTGIEVQSGGDIAVSSSGDITAGAGLLIEEYYNPDYQLAYTYYSGTLLATGINATSNGEGAHVAVDNAGDIAVAGALGATGIAATSSGYGGTASVANSGDIHAAQDEKYGYGAYGIVVSADGDATIDNSGAITVESGGIAYGAVALSFAGDASVTNSGDISVTTDAFLYYGANGIVAFSGNGSAYAGNSGNIDVTSKYISSGIDVSGQQGATASNSGDISVDAWRAYGIRAESGNGDVAVSNEGSIYATYGGGGGRAFGVLGVSGYGDVAIDNSGEITTVADGQSAGIFGVSYAGDVDASNSGVIEAYSATDVAVGIFARADYGTASVDNSGSIDAYSYEGSAYGVVARGAYAEIGNSGNVIADGIYSAGLRADGYYGAAVTSTGGSVQAFGVVDAVGIRTNAFEGDSTIANDAYVTASSLFGYAAGLVATSAAGNAGVVNSGDIVAASLYGPATGIVSYSIGYDAGVANSGNVAVYSRMADATGILGYSAYGNVDIGNSGYVVASSMGGNAIGIYGYSAYGDVGIDNAGDISVYSYYGLADGIFASGANVDVANSGAVFAFGYSWAAGIEAQGADSVQVSNSGDIDAMAAGLYQGYVYSYNYGVGGVFAYAPGGQAFGIYATAGEGGAAVANSGGIAVQGGYATGIEVQSGGDIAVVNSGDITAGTGLMVEEYYNPDYQLAYTYFSGTQLATGINATSNGEGAHVGIRNSGDISADGIFGATGIAATSSGYGGTVGIFNEGDILPTQDNGSGYGAYGLSASADGNAVVVNAGGITVASEGGATGVSALSFAGDAAVGNSGDIVVSSTSGDYTAYGISAFSGYGDVFVDNSGSVYAGSDKYQATAVDARSYGDVNVANSGSLYANGFKYAFGVYATSGAGDINIGNAEGGEIGFYSYLGRGWGVFGYSSAGDVNIVNDGAVQGYAYGQSSGLFGRAGQGDVGISNSGSIDVASGGDVAVGIFARADDGNASVTNSGDIAASNFPGGYYAGYSVYGIFARGAVAEVANAGNIVAEGYISAYGVLAVGTDASTIITTSASDIEASAANVAFGIAAQSTGGNAAARNGGAISVDGGFGAVGVQAYSATGTATAGNAGSVSAASDYGIAIGVSAHSIEGNAVVTNAGTIQANADYAVYGIVALSEAGDVNVGNQGQVSAAGLGYVYGIFAQAHGNVTINNTGTVSIAGLDGGTVAAILMESLYGTSTLNNSGTITINAPLDKQVAVLGSDAVDIINNTGTIIGAVVTGGGDDVFNNGNGGVWRIEGDVTDFGDGNDRVVNASGGLIDIRAGGALAMGGGNDTITNAAGGTISLNSGTVTMGDGDDRFNNAAGGLVILQSGGTITMGDGSGSEAFANAGVIRTWGEGFVEMGGGTLTNSGVLEFRDGAADDVLVIEGDLAGSGTLNLDVSLLNKASDLLYVDGNVAGNAVQTVNVDFPGMPTTAHTSVDFAFVSGTSAAGNFVAGQVIGWSPANFLDLDLTVSSRINAANTANDVFSLDVDVAGLNDTGTLAASAASGAANFLQSQVGTFRQRLGVNPYGDPGKVMSAFVRFYSDEGDVDPTHQATNFGQGGNFAYDQASWGHEVGVNANLFGDFHAGVVLGNADSRQRLTGAGVGENRMDGMTWGAYATWYQPQGFYLDLSGRWMAMDIRSNSAAGVIESRARTHAYSLELGYELAVGGFNLVPQAQYVQTEIEDVRTFHGDRADFLSHGGTFKRGRLGLEFNTTLQAGGASVTPYASINAVRQLDGESRYTVADNFFGRTSTEGTSRMAELGVGVQQGGLGFTLGANWTDGGAFESFVGGQAILRFAW